MVQHAPSLGCDLICLTRRHTIHYVTAETADPAAIIALLERSRMSSGRDVLSEHKATRVGGSDDSRAVVGVDESGKPRAYAQGAWHRPVTSGGRGHWAIEVVFDPGFREPAAVPELVRATRDLLPKGDRVAIWSADDDVIEALAASGYRETRTLLKLSMHLPFEGTAELPAGMRIEPFLLGSDEDVWLELNNAAFAGHPENGALQPVDLAERMSRPWFDRNGFLMAWEGERLVGSCWTKMHDRFVGEIYIIAVDPEAHGRGIGRMLLVSGIGYLERQRQATRVMLYVEGDNESGLGLYRSIGFETETVTRQFEEGAAQRSQPKR